MNQNSSSINDIIPLITTLETVLISEESERLKGMQRTILAEIKKFPFAENYDLTGPQIQDEIVS